MKTKEKVEQGKGAADHMMPLDYLFFVRAIAPFTGNIVGPSMHFSASFHLAYSTRLPLLEVRSNGDQRDFADGWLIFLSLHTR